MTSSEIFVKGWELRFIVNASYSLGVVTWILIKTDAHVKMTIESVGAFTNIHSAEVAALKWLKERGE